MRTGAPYRIDKLQGDMTPEERDSFQELLTLNPNGKDVYRWLSDRGYEVNYESILRWLKFQRPKGELALAITEAAKKLEGIDGLETLDYVSGLASILLKGAAASYAKLSDKDKAMLAPSLMREARQAASQSLLIREQKDRRETMEAIAFKCFQALREVFRDADENFQQALEYGIKAAEMKMKEELK